MKIYVTFGQNHAHQIGEKFFNKDCVAMLEAEDYGKDRAEIFEIFGGKFCTTYSESEILPVMKYFPRGVIEL